MRVCADRHLESAGERLDDEGECRGRAVAVVVGALAHKLDLAALEDERVEVLLDGVERWLRPSERRLLAGEEARPETRQHHRARPAELTRTHTASLHAYLSLDVVADSSVIMLAHPSLSQFLSHLYE